MKFDIRYVTTYRYAGSVVDNMNALRVKPVTNTLQRPSGFRIAVRPEARTHEHVDYFGTTVHEFEVLRPHDTLEIEASMRCATSTPPEPPQLTWAGILTDEYRERGADFLLTHEAARPHPTLDALARDARGATPLATACRLTELIPQTFEYRKGVTYVGSTVAELMEHGAGVCQDFVHAALAVLRGMGIAARYCSGYLFTSGADGVHSVEVDTHAWLEVLLPAHDGGMVWVGMDPTNAVMAGECHVKIGHGRWYSDVPPIKGVFRGQAGGDLHAKVTMTLLADEG